MAAEALHTPLSPTKHALRVLSITPHLAFLAVSLLLFVGAQCMSWIFVRPLSRPLFVRFNRFAAGTWFGFCIGLAEVTHGMRIDLTGDELPSGETVLVLANHQDMPDIGFLMALARTKGRLGDLKWFVKDSFKYLPGVGWGLWFLENLFVKRRWSEDKEAIRSVFRRLVEDARPFWIVIFPEGTRLTRQKLRRAQSTAVRRGRVALSHLLPPHTRGFAATVSATADRLDAVYDVTIGYPEGVPTIGQFLCGYAPVAHLHVVRWPIETLPSTTQELTSWLRERHREKDRLLALFSKDRRFPSGGGFETVHAAQ